MMLPRFLFLLPATAALFLTGCTDDDDEYGRTSRSVGHYAVDRGYDDVDFVYQSGRPYSREYGPLVVRSGRYYYTRSGSTYAYNRPTTRSRTSVRTDYRRDDDRGDYRRDDDRHDYDRRSSSSRSGDYRRDDDDDRRRVEAPVTTRTRSSQSQTYPGYRQPAPTSGSRSQTVYTGSRSGTSSQRGAVQVEARPDGVRTSVGTVQRGSTVRRDRDDD
jgi:hypothetical protein